MRLPSSASSSSSVASATLSPVQHRAKIPPSATHNSSKPGRRRMDRELSGYPLQRGSACLSCRKRKMKCDAGKPACGQCVKANRAGDCDYDDGKSKSRTQLLHEKVAMLESRLRELEGSPSSSPACMPPAVPPLTPGTSTDASSSHHHHPNNFYTGVVADDFFGGSIPSSSFPPTSFLTHSSPSPSASPWLGPDAHTPHTEDLPWDMDPLAISPNDLLKVSGPWWEADVLPPRIQRFLIYIFLPHRHQCGFEVDVNRFQASLTGPEPPHPALLNAIYALACHFSLSPVLSPHEPRFVTRALCAISSALETSDRLVHVLQASCLLAMLFFAKGRLLEGYYHAGAGARLAVGLGLHQISFPDWLASVGTAGGSPHGGGVVGGGASGSSLGGAGAGGAASSSSSTGTSTPGGPSCSILPPPADATELGERILAFWQVYNLDRCWAVATGLPVALSDDKFPRTRIKTAWPRSLEEYELGHILDADYGSGPMHYLHARSGTNGAPLAYTPRDSTQALRAKAATLFERAARLATAASVVTGLGLRTGLGVGMGGTVGAAAGVGDAAAAEQFWVDFRAVDDAISRLVVGLPPVRGANAGSGGARGESHHPTGATTTGSGQHSPTTQSPSLVQSPGQGLTAGLTVEYDTSMFVVHALLHAATIQLHAPFVFKDAGARHRSGAAAGTATAQIHELREGEFAFLDPIMGTCWTTVAEALVREGMMLRATAAAQAAVASVGVVGVDVGGGVVVDVDGDNGGGGAAVSAAVDALNRQLDVVVFAMNQLGLTVPLAAYQATKVERSRVVSY